MVMIYNFLEDLFLRAPFYSFNRYDLERVPEVLATAMFRNAIFLASPSFYRQLEKKGFEYQRLSEKETFTLRKYYNRMCYRPVPFGSFASFSLLKWSDDTSVRLVADSEAQIHLLPDETLLSCLRKDLNPLTENLPVVCNPTLYKMGTEYRFIKSEPDLKGHYVFSLEAVPVQSFYTSLFNRIKRASMTTAGLIGWIVEFSSCPADEAADYVDFFFDSQVLFHSGRENVIKHNTDYFFNAGAAMIFSEYRTIRPEGAVPFSLISEKLKDVAPADCHQFYAAAERSYESGGPGEQVQQQLLKTAGLLQKLCLPVRPPALTQFITDFQARFDLEKVPLLLAIDPDAGIPYGNNTMSGIVMEYGKINFPEAGPKPAQAEWTELHRLLFNLLTHARQQGPNTPLIINESDLKDIQPAGLPAPSAAMLFRQAAGQIVIDYAGGITGISMIGRFSAFSLKTLEICRQLAAIEQAANPQVLFADIAQYSDTHVDNINRRQPVYPFQIPVNVYQHDTDQTKISPGDLLLYVRNGELFLESKIHGKRVIPRLATAYNPGHTGLDIFRLLCDMQHQGFHSSLNFSLETLFPGLSHYPRVVCNDVIICPATWRLDDKQLAPLITTEKGEEISAIRSLVKQLSLPRYISIGSSDQQLIFDLADEAEALFFLDNLQGKKRVTITEYFLPGRSVKSAGKPMAGQFAAFLYHRENVYRPAVKTTINKFKATRNFRPGSDWLYVKLFCTPESADGILTEVIAPVIAKHRKKIDCWFFIRYFENGHHLRLRIRSAKTNPGLLINDLNKALEKSGKYHVVKNFQIDTYRREMERYGPNLIEYVEHCFCAGSHLIVNYLQQQSIADILPSELLFGLFIAHRLASRFETDKSALADFYKQTANRFLKGFNADKQLKMDLDTKYRARSKEVEQILGFQPEKAELSQDIERLMDAITTIERKANHLSPSSRTTLLADLIHMQLNRTFKIKHRQQELMVYYFLHKYVTSKNAQLKHIIAAV